MIINLYMNISEHTVIYMHIYAHVYINTYSPKHIHTREKNINTYNFYAHVVYIYFLYIYISE